MAEAAKILEAKPRESLGTRVARRYRRQGSAPCVLLHEKDAPAHLLIPGADFERLLTKGARLIDLVHPKGKDKVVTTAVRWDQLGERVVHVDFPKVAMDELLTLEVQIVLKGKPIAVVEEGATLDHFVKTVKIQ